MRLQLLNLNTYVFALVCVYRKREGEGDREEGGRDIYVCIYIHTYLNICTYIYGSGLEEMDSQANVSGMSNPN